MCIIWAQAMNYQPYSQTNFRYIYYLVVPEIQNYVVHKHIEIKTIIAKTTLVNIA